MKDKMKEVSKRVLLQDAQAVLDRYANYEGFEDDQDAEYLLEDAMNIISRFMVFHAEDAK